MFRAVLAVALAVALLGASLPAVDTARVERADATVERELRRLADEMRLLDRREDPATEGARGPRWRVRVRLPRRSWTSAGIEHVSLSNRTGRNRSNGTVFRWRVDGGHRRAMYLPSVRVRPAEDGSLAFRTGGTHRLALGLVRDGGTTVVTVRRRG